MASVPEEFSQGKELAAYITWSSIVKPNNNFTKPAMLMSKNWMSKVWSWDHCFNAMNLVYNKPGLAWKQFTLPFDHQKVSGLLPDSISDSETLYNFTKPPIQGWALKWMYKRSDSIDGKNLAEVYDPLCRWTNWWLNFRDDDDDGIPQYNHGNSSGWDNSTWFSEGVPVESPDLSAYLVVQMDVLSEIAEKLGKKTESELWEERSNILLRRLIDHFWKENLGQFIAVRSGTHETVVDSNGLLVYMPIILGKKLPEKFVEKLVKKLEEKFLTEHGLATESPNSSYYKSDGYWRGPIWAPSTMIIVDGLRKIEKEELYKKISRRFCRMAEESGMAENFDALTGEGYRDKAYTWTASVFSILAHEYVD